MPILGRRTFFGLPQRPEGECSILKKNIKGNEASATFTVGSVALTGSTCDSNANHDPDGDGNGTAITINRP